MPEYRGPSIRFREVWYTGRNIDPVAASRTVIAVGPGVGSVLVKDPYNHDQRGDLLGNTAPVNDNTDPKIYAGADYTQPQTNYLHGQKVFVVKVNPTPPGFPTTGANAVVGRWCVVAECAEETEVMLNGTVAVGDALCVTNGTFALSAQAIGTGSVGAAAADIATIWKNGCAMALQTNATGPNLRCVRFGGPFCLGTH